MTRKSATIIEIAIIAAVWCATIATIHPRGDFPLLDDWDFAIATWNFARTGHFHFTQFTVVSLRAMVLWGAAWTRMFGESFDVLRASTLTLSLATIVVVNRTLARAGVTRGVRLLASFALLFNPLFLWTSCTYMTDVPYIFASAVAFYFFWSAGLEADSEDGGASTPPSQPALRRRRSTAFVLAGAVAVIVSFFIRQNGVINIVPMLLFAKRRSHRVIGVAVIALYACLFFFKRDWLSGSPEMFAVHYHMWGESSFRLPEQIATLTHYVIFTAQNSAMFFLPLTLPLLLGKWSTGFSRLWSTGFSGSGNHRLKPVLHLILAAIIIWRIGDLAVHGYLFPYTTHVMYSDIFPGNIVFDAGVGPPMLLDTFSLGLDYPFHLAVSVRWTITLLSALLVIALLYSMKQAARSTQGPSITRLALTLAAIGTLALFASGYYFDRYALDAAWSLVLALPFVVPWSKRGVKTTAIVALMVTAIISTLAVQECFIWNRARWKAWSDLRARGIAVAQIDGGAEAFGLYELPNAPRAVARRGHPPREYAITLHPLDGYRVLATYPFTSFCGTRRGVIYTLQKLSLRASATSTLECGGGAASFCDRAPESGGCATALQSGCAAKSVSGTFC